MLTEETGEIFKAPYLLLHNLTQGFLEIGYTYNFMIFYNKLLKNYFKCLNDPISLMCT